VREQHRASLVQRPRTKKSLCGDCDLTDEKRHWEWSAIHAELQTGIESDGHIGGIIAELQCYSESSEGQNNVVKTQTHEREEGEISQARLKSERKLLLVREPCTT